MQIRDMFAEDINRPINGVIKVDQDAAEVIQQEVGEYVITNELKKHIISFFDYYDEAFDTPTSDIGVWISGFFGSGKSHFLKMLSYILENKMVGGVPTVEMFRKKFEDDPGTFMMIDKAAKAETETILFNIDVEGSINKDKTAVLRVFAKMFYNHLGFYGENLKVAMLEQYIDQQGKTDEFRRVFEKNRGKSWVEQRRAFAFNGKYLISTLMEVLDMSEDDAKRWFQDKTAVEFSIARLVEDMKSYVDSKPRNFRLLFMIDEVGQYVGTELDMLLNLQSLVEKIGSECDGKIWVMCTGQEAIDEIIKVRGDAFSRIQARFKTRLSLSSSSVDEVIQKRILLKKPEPKAELEQLYDKNDSVLRNLFSFTDSILDIKGYTGPTEFAVNFPFVPYQFIIMQKVFAEIRKHGNSGKHLSGGERSMLSGFQEAAQKVQDQDEYALVPFFRFYDTVHSFLDGSIRRVIERCQKAADSGAGLEDYDVEVLKLLYLIRYVDDIPANVDNIVILMADDIRADKITMRETVRKSLDRLMSQNYIGRNGDTYNFLTDEEQDIQREIKNTQVDTSSIVERIAHMIFGEIYTTKKYRYGKYDFAFDQMVDGVTVGAITGGMRLKFLTVATDATEKSELRLMPNSHGQAIVVLDETPYYEDLENAMKIRKYVKQRNVAQLPKSVQDIIRDQQDEAGKYELAAAEELKKAIVAARFYVDGEHIEIKSGDAKSKLDQALEYLVIHVYSRLDLVVEHAETDADILAILSGTEQYIAGAEPNRDAAAEVEEYLIMQDRKNLPTSMADVQSRYQAIPYGWKEIDIAAVVALLIFQQKVTVKYGGATIQPNNPKLPDMLRKKSEIGRTGISKRKVVTAQKMKLVKDFLREYFDVMDVPDDEDSLIAFIVNKFNAQKAHYEDLKGRYANGRKYPDGPLVSEGIRLIADVLSQQKDNIALIDRVLRNQDPLLDNKEDMQSVEAFFKSQVQTFDAAWEMLEDLNVDKDYISCIQEAYDAMNRIRLLVKAQTGKFDYGCIPELNQLMKTVRDGHNGLLDKKRAELQEVIQQCMGAIHTAANGDMKARDAVSKADKYYEQKKTEIAAGKTLNYLDGLMVPMWNYKDDAVSHIEVLLTPPKPVEPPKTPPTSGGGKVTPPPKKVYKTMYRQSMFPAKTLESEADVDAYLAQRKEQIMQLLRGCDGIILK
ncbi:MAG: BREX system P-loop protein BrxC [Lachnospiraceae bacterium]|nr:BREX system P-loop protein BrxC [Lachnospiraceae bacterium]